MSSTLTPKNLNGAASGPSVHPVHTGPSLSPDRYRLSEAELKKLEERFHARHQLYTRLATKHGTPPKKGNWSENARTVIAKRIVVKDKDGNPSETPEEMAWRVALAAACAEADFLAGVADSVVEQRILDVARQFYDLMVEQRAFPNSPTLTNAGKPDLLSLAACFVLPVEDSLDKIFDTVKHTALIHKSGGGCVDGRAKVFTTFCGVEDFAVLYQRLRATGREPVAQGNGLAMDVRDLNIRTLSQNPDTGRFEMGRISHVWSFDVPREQQRQVVTGHGSVITSEWHPFMVLQGGRLVEKRADELKPGDILLRSNRSAQDSWPITEEKEVAGRRLTPDLAWLLGYFQGDGSLGQARIGNPKTRRYGEDTIAWVQDALGITPGPKHIMTVPDYIYKSPLSVIRAYLAGLVDSDGTVDSRGRVSVTMAEEALTRGVYHLADLLGFEPAWRERAPHGKGRVPVYQVTLSSLDKISALRSFLLPELTDGIKKERLAQVVADRTFSTYERIPLSFDELAPLLEAAGVATVSTAIHRGPVSVGGESFWLANFKESRGIGRHNLRRLVGALRRVLGDSPTLDLFESVAENATVVTDVRIPEEKADLYDFTVEGHSTYVASGGEFISIHNTGFNFSYLRPKGARVGSTGGVSSGPVSFMNVIGAATESVKQGGCVAPDTLVSSNRGIVPIRELGPEDAQADSWHAHTEPLVVSTDDGPRSSDEFYNHGVARVRHIQTKSGYHLTATPEHRIRVIDEEGRYVWRHLADLKPGDWAVLQKGHMQEPADLSLPPLAREPHFNATPVTLPKEASEQLGEFIGYVIGDGAFNQYNPGATTGRLILTVADKQPDVAHWVVRTSRKLFGITPLREKKENDGSTNYFLNATTLVSWLRQLGVSKESADTAQVPDVVFRKGAAMARGFLRGLFTADGTVAKEGYPSLSSVSSGLIDDVQQLLLAVGVPSSVSTVTNRDGAFGNKPLHRLRITTRAGIETFAQQIGFIDAERNAVLNAQLQKAWEFNDVIPNQEKVVAAVYAGPGRGSRIAALAEKHEEIRNSPLAQFLTNDQFYDQIETIEEAESLTLDLSVPANNTYIANGFVSHNTRRGANMGMLRIDHPDILEFIESKRHGNRTQALTNFNISVLVPDSFMEKLKTGEDYELIHPKTGTNLDPDGRPLGTLNSREIWDKLVNGAWETGDPGVVFVDRLERDNPTPHIGKLECTNPCGEQPLLPFEACNLGSINVAKYVVPGQDGKMVFDLKRLAADSRTMVRFLDDVIQSSWYALPEIFDIVHGNRKIGVGVMGYGDALIDMEIPYDSEEALTVAEELMKTIHLATVEATRELAKERGAFPNFKGSVYERNGEPPRRNALTTTIAPTGTIGLLADAVCAGVEPLFAVAYMRTTADGIRLPYVHPRFEAVAKQEGWYSPELMEKIANVGHVRDLPEVPEKWQKVFVTAHEVTPEWHVRTQATFQKWTDNAVSKTVNFPNEAQPSDVERVYKLAYELNCKGVTIFRDGSLDTQVLTVGTKPAPTAVPIAAPSDMPTAGNGMQILPGSITRKMEIPDERSGFTKTLQTPLGKMHITVNEIAKGLPIEVFTTIGKAGSDITADAEAIGRLISLVLQLGGHISLVTHTLRGIGGASTVGFGPNRVTSMADAIAKFLEQKYLEEEEHGSGLSLGICPECGKAAVVPEAGCATCKECGWKAC